MVVFDRPVVLPRFLAAAAFATLRHEIVKLSRMERSYVPLHKKGGTIAYGTILRLAPRLDEFYRSAPQLQTISEIVQLPLKPTPQRDQSSLSVLVYERPGDHIGWHYDHNFYFGRHFTVLLAIENRGHGAEGLSSSRLFVKICDVEREIPTPANTLVVFEGARVLHKVTPIASGEQRLILSMTYCTDARNSVPREIARRIKDTAFFGLRALWT